MGGCCATELGPSESEFESGCFTSAKRQFVIQLATAPDEDMGLEVDIADDVTASITKVLDQGAVPSWNRQRKFDDQRVREGDHIVEVNGVRGSANDLISVLKSSSKLEVVIQRPAEFLAAIRKEKETDLIGLDVGYTKISTTLLVHKVVTSGCVEKWNEAHPATAVRRNDRIKEVNGTRGNCSEMMRKIKAKDADTLRIVVTRCE